MRLLFVTHRHFYHSGGLAPLPTALAFLPEAFLSVHATPGTLEALREPLSLTMPGVEGFAWRTLRWRALTLGEPVTAGDAEIIPFEVGPSLECVGFRVSQGGSTMVHAADTRPCPNVLELAVLGYLYV
jgi:glyoxylase-like metal-dependent hydrolase (beta-lactamase superfamily II)